MLLALPIGMLAQGTTWQTATQLNNGGTGSGTLDGTTTNAWFKIEVPEEGRVHFTLTTGGSLSIYRVQLCRISGNEPVVRNNTGWYPESGTTLEATNIGKGTYYVQVIHNGGSGTFSLSYGFTPCSYTNDAEPNDEGGLGSTLVSGQPVQGRLGYVDANDNCDANDWYKIEVPQDGRVQLVYKCDQTYDLEFFKVYFHWFNSAAAWGRGEYAERASTGWYVTNDTLTITDVGKGAYYVQLSRNKGHGGYTLEYIFTPNSYANDDEPNDEAGTGHTLSDGDTVEGHLGYTDGEGYTDKVDWYKIEVPKDGRVQLVYNCNQTYGLELYKVYFKWYNSGASWGQGGYDERASTGWYVTNDTLTITDVGVGTYYIQLQLNAGHGGYALKYIFTPNSYANDVEPNDDEGSGQTLEIGETVQGHLGYTDGKGYTDKTDWYKIEVPQEGRVQLAYNCDQTYGLELYKVYLYYYNTNGAWGRTEYTERASTGWYVKNDTLTITDAGKGTYYVKLQNNKGHGGYTLKYIFTPCSYGNDSEPNDKAEQGSEIAIGQTVQGRLGYTEVKDSVSHTDKTDWYKIVVPQDGRVQLVYNCEKTYGLEFYKVYFRWYRESDESYPERASTGWYVKNDTLTINDAGKGTYYVQLELNGGHGGYTLKYIFTSNSYVNDTEPNDEIAQVTTVLASDETVTGHLGYLDGNNHRDTSDWFRLDTRKSSLLTVTYEPDTTSNLELYKIYIVKQKGEEVSNVAQSGWYIKNQIMLTVDNVEEDATYYVHLEQNAGHGGYALTYGAPQRFDGSEIRIAYVGRNTTRLGIPSPYDVKVENIGSGHTGSFFVAIPATPDIEFLRAVIPTEEGKIEVDREDFAIYDDEEGDCAVFIIPDLGPFQTYTFTVYMQGRVPNASRGLSAYAIPLGKQGESWLGALKSAFKEVKDNFEWRAMLDDGITVATVQACIDAHFFTEQERQQYSQVIGKTEQEYKVGYREPVAHPVMHYTSKVTEKLIEVGNPVVATFGALRASGQIANSLVTALRRKLWLWIYKDLGYVQDEPEVMDGRMGVNGIVRSWDPNEMVGPQGFGDKNYIGETKTMDYRILFENKAEATDNAYRIRISDELDENVFDVATARFGSVSHEGTEYNWIMKREGNKLYWEIEGIELPPNVNAPEGEGYVTFSVDLKPGLKNGTQIRNKAAIVFDYNETIETNEYVNTLDLVPPTTEMWNTTFKDGVATVTCKGSDDGSGIGRYMFYASSGGSDYRYIGQNTEPSIDFSVKEGIDYNVYAVAIDHVGNVQMAAPQAISFNATGITTLHAMPSTSWTITRLNGTVVASGQGTPDMQLPAGVYIIRQGNNARKVIVK